MKAPAPEADRPLGTHPVTSGHASHLQRYAIITPPYVAIRTRRVQLPVLGAVATFTTIVYHGRRLGTLRTDDLVLAGGIDEQILRGG
jgi:hypothetical protein